MPNPGAGLPWAMCWTAPNQFIWRLFPTYEEAVDAARAVAIGDLKRDGDFSIAIARLPHQLPSTLAIEVGIEATDALLACSLAVGRTN